MYESVYYIKYNIYYTLLHYILNILTAGYNIYYVYYITYSLK